MFPKHPSLLSPVKGFVGVCLTMGKLRIGLPVHGYFEAIIKCFSAVGMWRLQYAGWRKVIADVLFFSHFATVVCSFVVFEFIFMFQSFGNDYIELLKTLGTTSYHLICVSFIIRFNTEKKKIAEMIATLQRDTFKDLFQQDKKMLQLYEEIEGKAHRTSFAILIAFMFIGSSSLSTSYCSAFLFPGHEFDSASEESISKRKKPYNSYTFLNLENTSCFILDTVYQAYSIVYMSACFVCKYNACLYTSHFKTRLR